MKKITLSLFLLISSLSLSTQECSLGEKEFLELTYMTKEELISDYCASTEFGKSTQIQGVKLADAGASQSGLELIEDGTTCLNYAEKVFRVLRKDFKIKSKEDIKCPEVKQKIGRAKEEKKIVRTIEEKNRFLVELDTKLVDLISKTVTKQTSSDEIMPLLEIIKDELEKGEDAGYLTRLESSREAYKLGMLMKDICGECFTAALK